MKGYDSSSDEVANSKKWLSKCGEQPLVNVLVEDPGIGATKVAIKYDPEESAFDTGTASKSYVIPRVSEVHPSHPSL